MMNKSKRAESRARYYVRNQSKKRGWDLKHVSKGGDFLEENEITDYFHDIGLEQDKPDFLICWRGEPCIVIETKNDIKKSEESIKEAIDYSNKINKGKKYRIRIAIGAAGEEDYGFTIIVKYFKDGKWIPLKSHGCEITNIPTRSEVELALKADDGTTSVSVPSITEFIDSAIELSSILRIAKIEAHLRPKVIGALVLAMYEGDIDTSTNPLLSINKLVAHAIDDSVDLDTKKQKRLKESLYLSGGDFERLSPKIFRVISLLKRLNIRSVLQTDTDFLGLFYEAFLRYGYDNTALGIVFTPRHITRFCVDLIGTKISDRVIDIACGTGGFLVAAFDRMMTSAKGSEAIKKVKQSLYGSDTNPTIWALSTLNMFFRGDGKSHIENISCFNPTFKKNVSGKFTRAFLNPPFSQEGEPERDFIDATMSALEPEGLCAIVVKAGIFADDDNKHWRNEFTRRHSVLGVISLPEDLFYPTAAPTSILIAKAHIPQDSSGQIFMARIWNDGFEKLKGRRVECDGSQLVKILELFNKFKEKKPFKSEIATKISGGDLLNGSEWSPQQWLPQPRLSRNEYNALQQETILSLYQSISMMPDIADELVDKFGFHKLNLPKLEYNKIAKVSYFFKVINGKSIGEKHYSTGNTPYISSGDSTNSIIRLVNYEQDEIFDNGGITVTAFGQAYLQPWSFIARGNGGSSVRILIPKFSMTVCELLWFIAQINSQKWRFFYGRMAIKSRLEKLQVMSPPKEIHDETKSLSHKLVKFRDNLMKLSEINK